MSSKKKTVPKKRTARSRKKRLRPRFFLILRRLSLILIVACLFLLLFQSIPMRSNRLLSNPSVLSSKQQKFIDTLLPLARKNYRSYGILPSITLSQAILESNWGESRLSTEYHNYFGIKSFKKSENRIQLETQEFYNNQMNQTQDYFRTYRSLEESVAHHGRLLGTAPRYQKITTEKDYTKAAQELYEASYSTDPKYPNKLIELIERYHLDQYDQ